MNDVLARVEEDGRKAVGMFLPSIANPPQPPPPPPNPMAYVNPALDGIRALKMVAKVEAMAYRTARGLPPIKPVTPEEQFGNVLDVAHTRALSRAIANHPEEERSRLIAEAHDSATKWIGAHNGKVVVHGKVEIASGADSAEKLAQRIVNDTVNEHDERESGESGAPDNGGSKGSGKPDEANDAPGGSGEVPHHSPRVRTDPVRSEARRPAAPNPPVPAEPSLSPEQPPDNGSVPMPGAILDAPETIVPSEGEVPPESTPQVSAPVQLTKGHPVTLKDGSKAEVQWHHPGAKLLRVKVDGKSRMINPDKDLA